MTNSIIKKLFFLSIIPIISVNHINAKTTIDDLEVFASKIQKPDSWQRVSSKAQETIDFVKISNITYSVALNRLLTYCKLRDLWNFKLLMSKHEELITKLPFIALSIFQQFANNIFQQILLHQSYIGNNTLDFVHNLRTMLGQAVSAAENHLKSTLCPTKKYCIPLHCKASDMSLTHHIAPLLKASKYHKLMKILFYSVQSQIIHIKSYLSNESLALILSDKNLVATFDATAQNVLANMLNSEEVNNLVNLINHPVIQNVIHNIDDFTNALTDNIWPMLSPFFNAINTVMQE